MKQPFIQIDPEHCASRLVVLPGSSASAPAAVSLPLPETLPAPAVVLLDVDRKLGQLHPLLRQGHPKLHDLILY